MDRGQGEIVIDESGLTCRDMVFLEEWLHLYREGPACGALVVAEDDDGHLRILRPDRDSFRFGEEGPCILDPLYDHWGRCCSTTTSSDRISDRTYPEECYDAPEEVEPLIASTFGCCLLVGTHAISPCSIMGCISRADRGRPSSMV